MTRSWKYTIAAVVILGVLLVVLSSCSTSFDKLTEKYKDAPRGQVNDNPADVMTFPDGFSNVSAKCDGTTRVYVVFKGDKTYGSVAVSPNHPACR